MNFLWQTMAARLLEFKKILGPNFKRILILDREQPAAQTWWAEAGGFSCDALTIQTVNDFNQLKDQDVYDLILWTLPPIHLIQEPIAKAVWSKLRMHCNGFMIFVTPGPMSIPVLNRVLGSDVPNVVSDFHDIGDQLAATGWQRPMLQGQSLPIQYHKRVTVLEDWLAFGEIASHPLLTVKLIPDHDLLQTSLDEPVVFDITVGLVYNGPNRTVQQQFDDGSIAIPVNQIKKRN